MAETTPEAPLTRGQKAARTRAANKKKKAAAAKAQATTAKVLADVKPAPKRRATKPRAEKHVFTFVHKGETLTVTHEGSTWSVTAS